jgi:hypothetical protein
MSRNAGVFQPLIMGRRVTVKVRERVQGDGGES